MSTHDRDDDLAPVTDLFGARSSRRGGGTTSSSSASSAEGALHVDRRDHGDEGLGRGAPRSGRESVTERSGAASGAQSGTGTGTGTGAGAAAVGAAGSGRADRVGASASDDARVVPIGRATRARASSSDDGGQPDDGTQPADAAESEAGARSGSAADDWRSPVIGDGTGRSARAEQAGYDEPEADARAASVFAIGDGSELDPADAPRPIEEQRAEAEQVSMRALGRKGVSTSELRKTLAARDLDDVVVEDELDRLTRVGLLDDLALATDLVDRLHDRKGLGRQGVVAELRRRGIAQDHIDQALETAEDDGDDELARAIELATKRARQLRGLDPDTAERRLSGFLMRKGYGSGVVRIAVERGLRGGGDRPRGTVRFE